MCDKMFNNIKIESTETVIIIYMGLSYFERHCEGLLSNTACRMKISYFERHCEGLLSNTACRMKIIISYFERHCEGLLSNTACRMKIIYHILRGIARDC